MRRKLTDSELSRLRLNPEAKGVLTKLEKEDGLWDDREPKPLMGRIWTAKYIIYMYDFNSPIRKEESNYMRRKYRAAILAGSKMGKRKFEDDNVEKVLFGGCEVTNKLIVSYLRGYGDNRFLMHAVLETVLDDLSNDVFSQNDDVKYSDVITSLKKLRSDFEELDADLFGDKPESELRKELYGAVQKERLRIRPEDIVESLRDGDSPIDVEPYGKGYTVDKMTYKGSTIYGA